ncbi:AGAP002682-PB-like protein [Anopheles sinensis]|uniref:[histone H3]-dimethyl-L-lysine(9) demethylase n=1 Tax=Anopheles sinensis TaxID=74873 RepID=A0A084WR96_ANOSI|nr:AGAP002682-PB-like protein [Anopheles sinensis]
MEFKPQILPKLTSSSKRKNAADDQDPTKKRKARPKANRTSEPHLQNVPCYKLSSRLPRCRECGRSAATRSRHAQSIFCRFYAFRKLRNNELGKLEVTGFADPYLDPKEADISLWSANLKQAAKFLLGQVGYKFCELFHQEKEAHYEHLSADKTIAWKQAVQGIREMCDVCQTTLFNHHWVCSTCGFVVCIDCYKCRKRGIVTNEPNTKDKDTNGWLLCSGTKEPHCQDRLMLTQIIPSNCLYKLVRQMHGICALLEIPLNCECPLSKEPRFRKVKEKFEFIYPITVHCPVPHAPVDEQVFYDFNGPINAPPPASSTKITRMVSITIKNIEQQQKTERRNPAGLDDDANMPIECRVEFAKQFQPEEQGQCREDDDDGANVEKDSYSFERFQEEICTDGEHFDESLYKMTAGGKAIKKEQQSNENGETEQAVETEGEHSNGNGCEKSDLITCSNNSNTTNDIERRENLSNVSCTMIVTKNEDSMDQEMRNGAMNNLNSEEEANLSKEAVQMDTSNNDDSSLLLDVDQNKSNDNGNDRTVVKKKGATKQSTLKDPPIQTVPYSEEGRFKPSPPMDSTTLTMIVKQMVKFDKTVDIFSTFERHMASETGHQDDFEECITIKPERVRRFLLDFLDDFVYLRGQNSSDSLTNERQLLEYNRQIKDGLKFRNKGERRMQQCNSSVLYPEVAHEWLCNGKLLRLLDPLDVRNYQSFHDQWERGQPVMVSAVSSKMNMDLWIPEAFGRDFGEQVNDLINCFNGKIVRGHPMKVFWDGFECIRERLLDERERSMMLKLKDWPPGDDFAEMMPTRFYDLMKSLPLGEYTRREGRLNLASRLSSFFVRPDLGPKMYSAYGSALHPNKGTTNLHLDISDAVNVMVYVGVPTDVPRARYNEKVLEVIDTEDCDYLTRERIRKRQELPGALWHIYHAQDADKIRALLNKIELERGGTIKPNHDPIHDQKWYLDRPMRRRLQQEYGVEGYAIVQCSGDAIFIPAGAPHQVRNLHNCIKVAEDFVSPENISYCFKLTNEFRHLSKTHSNHEDKLQIKNIIYHTVKDAVSSITNPLIMTANREADKSVV